MNKQQARRRSRTADRTVRNLVIMILAVSCGPMYNGLARAAERRPFTVKDSIEISSFVNPVLWTVNQDPPTEPIVSPNGQAFLVVTQRGILASNKIESTIWVFERQQVADFVSKRSSEKPRARMIASHQATSNTPVISDVRWLEDSRQVAFLAKTNEGQAQLYTVDSVTGIETQLTDGRQSVSAYDIRRRTIAYATIDDIKEISENQDDVVDVTGKSIWTLLWRGRSIRERDESRLLTVPNTLHIDKNGRALTTPLSFEGGPLRLFFPILSLSPDERSLVTIAQVATIPPKWKMYQPRFGYEDLKLDSANKSAMDTENAWKASQFVNIDLDTGTATPILDAPAGRSLFQIFAPTKAIWSPDSETVLLSDTFLPLTENDSEADAARRTAPAAVTVDLRRKTIHLISYFPQPAQGSPPPQFVSAVAWDATRNVVDLLYASRPDNLPIASRETYRWINSRWTRAENSDTRDGPFTLSIDQDLDQSPVPVGYFRNRMEGTVIWDPNPQLAEIALGKASIYEWRDNEGNSRQGILVLPSGYKPGQRYPLVIQTHGYEAKKFFADGIYTTGSGGRALCGRGIVVLQVDQYSRSANPAHDAQVEVEALRSAIAQLTTEGLIDAKRVGIIGFSFTVYHVLYAITHNPELFAAASITDGNDLSYWLYLLWTDIPFAQQMAEAANGGIKPFGHEGLSKWQESAPGFNLDRVQTPLLISCLEKGTLVATWDIYGGLRTLGKPVDMIWLKNEDAPHVLVQPHHRYLSQEHAVDWFDFWLNGHEDAGPEKARQYLIWRDLQKQKKGATLPIDAP